MRLAILDLCVWLPEYQSGQPRFGEIVATWVARAVPEASLSVIAVEQGAPLPDVTAFDGYVLSGSDKGVYDEAPWMAPLRAFLLAARAAGKPLVGLCFGHQIMADVFGGKAQKVGPQQVGVRQFDLGGQVAPAHVWHQDQVTQLPPGARVIASADYCPIAGLAYDFPALSVQFHPEYSASYAADFLRRSRGVVLSETETDAALAQFDSSAVATDLFTEETAAFLRRTINGKT